MSSTGLDWLYSIYQDRLLCQKDTSVQEFLARKVGVVVSSCRQSKLKTFLATGPFAGFWALLLGGFWEASIQRLHWVEPWATGDAPNGTGFIISAGLPNFSLGPVLPGTPENSKKDRPSFLSFLGAKRKSTKPRRISFFFGGGSPHASVAGRVRPGTWWASCRPGTISCA